MAAFANQTEGLPEPFTAPDLAEALGIRQPLAGKMADCLRKADLIRSMGKRRQANLYGVADP